MSPKIVACIVIMCLFVGKAAAQNTQPSTDKLDYLKKVEKYRRMKITGVTLTVVGTVLTIVGTTTFLNTPIDEEGHNLEAGALGMVVGQACIGAGIPLWIVGANNQKGYNKKLQQLTVKVNATPRAHGLTLTYRF